MNTKLIQMHGAKTHKAVLVRQGQQFAPLCQARIWNRGAFTGAQVIHAFDGDESEIDCKRCRSKMRKI